uniref:Cytochrome c oxidase subunit 3 n=1 Tax=Gnathostomula paradoxa TaxID=66783 RepID=A0A0F6PZQ6_9BILA|nr:cytochrome c oxidase subunit 3 [Gnathostomula paradoxa]AKD00038.1 cytochrome c oxidase subunit 3 [Gnathostomula paradoxa]
MFFKHNFHIVMISPWPFITASLAFSLIWSFIYLIKFGSTSMAMLNLTMLTFTLMIWWSNVSFESSKEGTHSFLVAKGIQYGMIWFIISEVMFFLAFFWSFFDNSFTPSSKSLQVWPNFSIEPLNPLEVPLLNTMILLSSGMTITLSHHSMVMNKFFESSISLVSTIFLGMYFTFLQYLEYNETFFSISDSFYGSIFFMGTGFHGFHVIVGTVFLLTTFIRLTQNFNSQNSHLGFELAAWYWHFVDVVWLFLYSCIYWWGK